MRISIALAFLFCLHSVANAEVFQLKKVMICDKSEIVFEKLASEFKETPAWAGKDVQDSSGYVVTVNQETGAWTLLQYDKDIACVLGVGTNGKTVFGKLVKG
jgi:hypothetical protein